MLTLTLPAKIESEGEIVVAAARLAKLITGFPDDVEIRIVADESGSARVTGARHRYRLPTIPRDHLPGTLRLTEEIGRVELAREELLELLRPSFAASTGK